MHDGVFMLLGARKRFLKKIGMFLRTCLSRVSLLRTKESYCSADSYTIVAPVSMVRVGGHHHSQRVHLLVYGRIIPPHPEVTVQVAFQGHQLDLDSVDSDQARSVTALTDRAGEFIIDENFICGPQVKFITSITSLPGIDAPTVMASLRLEKKTKSCCEKCDVRANKDPLPTATITIDFESHCQSSVTYWFENPYKKGTISRATEISYRPTELSALYLKTCPYKKDHTSIIDIFTTTKEHPAPRYQRVHTTITDEEFTRIAIFDPESTLKSALILV
ncbi:MAG: hypothetical protein D3922_05930 [Candidatus Electrothrix sp. AR1]|nr:hypothetical protein [Candidatus Electrothrix sp. AR1]